MAKPRQFSNKIPPATPEQPNERLTGHPLLKNESQVLDLLKRYQQEQVSEEVVIERIEEWRESLNRLAATADGQHFLRMLLKFSGIFSRRNVTNTVKMVEDAGKSAFYLQYVRPYLTPDNKQRVE